MNLSLWNAQRDWFSVIYRETHECIKNWFVRPLYELFFVWIQFISTVNIRGNLHFETSLHFVISPVILFQDGVFGNTEGLLPVQGRGSTQNRNSTKH